MATTTQVTHQSSTIFVQPQIPVSPYPPQGYYSSSQVYPAYSPPPPQYYQPRPAFQEQPPPMVQTPAPVVTPVMPIVSGQQVDVTSTVTAGKSQEKETKFENNGVIVTIDDDPISHYNHFINCYESLRCTDNDIELCEQVKKWQQAVILLILYVIPVLNLLILAINTICFIIYLQAAIIRLMNRRKVPDPFKRMYYDPDDIFREGHMNHFCTVTTTKIDLMTINAERKTQLRNFYQDQYVYMNSNVSLTRKESTVEELGREIT